MSEGATGGTVATSSSDPLEWQFLQCFGERTPGEEIQEGQQSRLVQYRQQDPLKALCGITTVLGLPACLQLMRAVSQGLSGCSCHVMASCNQCNCICS